MPAASNALVLIFTALGLFLAALFVVAIWHAWRRTGATHIETLRAVLRAQFGTVAWIGATYGLAGAGKLRFDGVPPTMVVLLVLTFALVIVIARSGAGERLARGIPLAPLVGFQAFRLPLELAMHRAYKEGVMPVQMSYSGYNFDIVTGITALIVGVLIATGRGGARLARVWNWLGIALLANVLVIAILSAPLPFRQFMNEPSNIWVTQAPFIWLPTIMVALALLGHLVLFRHLRERPREMPDIAQAA